MFNSTKCANLQGFPFRTHAEFCSAVRDGRFEAIVVHDRIISYGVSRQQSKLPIDSMLNFRVFIYWILIIIGAFVSFGIISIIVYLISRADKKRFKQKVINEYVDILLLHSDEFIGSEWNLHSFYLRDNSSGRIYKHSN